MVIFNWVKKFRGKLDKCSGEFFFSFDRKIGISSGKMNSLLIHSGLLVL